MPIVEVSRGDYVALVADGGGGTRGLTNKCINELAEFIGKKIVLLGKKVGSRPANWTDSIIEDHRGKTSLLEALRYTLGASLVIAPDGLLGYAAFIYNVPNIILFHEPQLIEAYWSADLNRCSVACYTGGFANDAGKILDQLKRLPRKN
jgi:ADP-heptose:LPS heptosyltransferase